VTAKVHPAAAGHVESKGATVGKPCVSRRSSYNKLDTRDTSDAILFLRSNYGCGG